ncbi:asparagine synthase (glutamine-hydrolyzing) [Runella limosa]|uniref:asparagine synthase (glutamine-hydrolyzing) n=1 Tax=Runella limosa TaxID=370978 RepID=UPI0004089161|nr:asparagine synthase (glutamine-hydrolyzing) [Runella limosa]
MCGITGALTFRGNYSKDFIVSAVKKQTNLLAHRGPDSEGLFFEEGLGLGHRRLSIIDLNEASNQPFTEQSKRYTIVFNGEIYNYQHVKDELSFYPWQTSSDTEVILAAYIHWGPSCLQKLNGMFAFSIWDSFKQELFFARDRLGVKPFYYYYDQNIFTFSSELRSLIAGNFFTPILNPDSVSDFLIYQSVRTPHTFFKNVWQLPPGHWGLVSGINFKINQYWSILESPQSPFSNLNYNDTLLETKRLFTNAVQSRLVSDVPVSAFLSGGIDSSAVVATMASLSQTPIETYSIVFNEKEFDESEYAQIIAQKYHTKHTELLLKPSQFLDELPQFFRSMDSPTTDGLNTYVVSKLVASTGTRVALSGLGGDELFAGYDGFKRFKKFNQINYQWLKPIGSLIAPLLPRNRSWNKISQLLQSSEWDLYSFYSNNRNTFLKRELQQLGFNYNGNTSWIDFQNNQLHSKPALSQYSISELTHYTLDVLLKDTDQMSMASSLEVREPFFDYQFVEFILQVPDKYKYHSSTPKSLLVNALGELLPHEIIYRPKKGFSFPWKQWLRNDIRDFCEVHLEQLSHRQLFENQSIKTIWHNFLHDKQGITWLHIWALVTLEAYLSENKL